MDDLDDELDVRYHPGLEPDVYYRCPSSESLDAALRNEIDKSVASLIPVEVVTEFVFATESTITVPVSLQLKLVALFQPADYPQSITVDHALCRDIEGKDKLKLQRAIAKSFIDTIQHIDGFKYTEGKALHTASDGARFKYLCSDSLQKKDRRSNAKKAAEHDGTEDVGTKKRRVGTPALATYDCGGAIHIKFSTKRNAINLIYKHYPIHRHVENRPANDDSTLSALANGDGGSVLQDATNGSSNGTKQPKRRRSKKDQVAMEDHFNTLDLGMPAAPEATKTPAKKKKRKEPAAPLDADHTSSKKKAKKGKQSDSPAKAGKGAVLPEDAPPSIPPVKGKCLRCREKGIKCNEAKPTCNQCKRGLWTCQYEQPGVKKRSKNGCINCRTRRRKCTEEKPSCAYCIKIDEDCEYAG